MVLFEKKFGRDFLATAPASPGIYLFSDASGQVVYVGKAKSLRNRLAQYRRARGGKMRKVVKAAHTLQWHPCPSDLQACLAEVRAIQKFKPRLNIAAAFSHRYPCIGFSTTGRDRLLCFTTTPECFSEYAFHGAYRSRSTTADAFFGLIRLLQFVGHSSTRKDSPRKAYSYEFRLRQLPASWDLALDAFLRGRCEGFLEELTWKLLENAGARAKRVDVQEDLDALKLFWETECLPLAQAIDLVAWPSYPVPQTDRDPLFLLARNRARPSDKAPSE